MRARTVALNALAVAAGAFVLCGCTAGAGSPSISRSPSSSAAASPGHSASPGASPPLMKADPAAGAAANRALFDEVNRAVLAKKQHPLVADFTAALAAVGFDERAMQTTADRTSANLEPGSILFSVLIGGDCLIGQWGSEVDGYHSTIAKPIDGQCLLGTTVSRK